ncbi:MAG: hypothetical protein Aurels2KO_53560 [Aureliella sp.]
MLDPLLSVSANFRTIDSSAAIDQKDNAFKRGVDGFQADQQGGFTHWTSGGASIKSAAIENRMVRPFRRIYLLCRRRLTYNPYSTGTGRK